MQSPKIMANLPLPHEHSPEGKRILYGVCGEGMGHAIRSGVVIEYLQKKNDVTIFAIDRAYDYLSQKFDKIYHIEGLNTVYNYDQINNVKTLISYCTDLPQGLNYNLHLMYNVAKTFKPDIIISDFEFYSNILSKILRIPLISLDNTHVITQCDSKVSKEYLSDSLIARSVVKSVLQRPRYYLINSFFFPPVKNPKNVKMFPPILRGSILRLKPTQEEHILVYQSTDSNLKLIDLLAGLDDEFIIYGFHKEEKKGNLTFKCFNEDEFFEDLSSARAVITNGGFTLISEALYLGKPVFSIPVKKHFEQILNAVYLERLKYGEFHEDPDKDDLEKFLLKLDFYRKHIKNNFRHDKNQSILRELDKIIYQIT
ncbi:MAG: hypothetical protein A4E27_01551 [Methanobacterium sp. PtaU1.Bin242]|nr:MAG: hypothetical protein A4E27_01551 [Methanobacterium sp. PtaU1.Bin242]